MGQIFSYWLRQISDAKCSRYGYEIQSHNDLGYRCTGTCPKNSQQSRGYKCYCNPGYKYNINHQKPNAQGIVSLGSSYCIPKNQQAPVIGNATAIIPAANQIVQPIPAGPSQPVVVQLPGQAPQLVRK